MLCSLRTTLGAVFNSDGADVVTDVVVVAVAALAPASAVIVDVAVSDDGEDDNDEDGGDDDNSDEEGNDADALRSIGMKNGWIQADTHKQTNTYAAKHRTLREL